MVLWDWLVFVPLGLLAGGLAGLLGIGGGLIFAPLLLWMGLSPHQALATSTFAIVPTALSGTLTHLFAGGFQLRAGLSIGVAAFLSSLLFSKIGLDLSGWLLLTLQVGLYLVVAATIRSESLSKQFSSSNPLFFCRVLQSLAVSQDFPQACLVWGVVC